MQQQMHALWLRLSVDIDDSTFKQPPAKHPAVNANIESLRDVIAHCIMPPNSKSFIHSNCCQNKQIGVKYVSFIPLFILLLGNRA